MSNRLELLARAVLERRALDARSLVQDMIRAGLAEEFTRPESSDADVRIVSAALAELLAERHGLPCPAWAHEFGPLVEPFFAVERALRWPGLRAQCERDAPEPLRRRRIYAPEGFLTYA